MTTHTTPDGRTFTLLGTEPYTRKDGSQLAVGVWEGACRVCGAPFAVKTPIRPNKSHAFGVVHCPTHRLTKEQDTQRWVDGIRRSRDARHE